MENNKTALIVEGGGQRGVFSFGITDTFIKKNFDPFDTVSYTHLTLPTTR